MKNFIIVALAALCVVLALRGCGRQSEKVVEKRDTVFRTRVDTVAQTNVKWRDRLIVRHDTMPYAVIGDTIAAGDTVYIPVPIARQTFTDDTTFRAEISGYNVTLDRMEVFRRSVESIITVDRTIFPKPKRWGIGIQAGYGVTLMPNGGVRPAPYIGVGISYNFLRF